MRITTAQHPFLSRSSCPLSTPLGGGECAGYLLVLATVRAVTRITSFIEVHSRLLYFILLNIIIASKRVTIRVSQFSNLNAVYHNRMVAVILSTVFPRIRVRTLIFFD